MAQVKYYDKRVGITYVYESQSYYDPEKHQSRSKRKLIGKIDPETGEIVPTGKKGRPRKSQELASGEPSDTEREKLYREALHDISAMQKQIASLELELDQARESLQNYRQILKEISDLSTLKRTGERPDKKEKLAKPDDPFSKGICRETPAK